MYILLLCMTIALLSGTQQDVQTADSAVECDLLEPLCYLESQPTPAAVFPRPMDFEAPLDIDLSFSDDSADEDFIPDAQEMAEEEKMEEEFDITDPDVNVE
jgi:hypothetical protein